MRTLTGIDLLDVPSELDRQLEPDAYKAITGGSLSGMTDIKPVALIDELNRVFGPCGVGWRVEYGGGIQYDQSDKSTVIESVYLSYAYLDDNGDEHWSKTIQAPGYNRNGGSPIDSIKGAWTNGLGTAAHALGWQSSVYWGRRGHDKRYDPNETMSDKVIKFFLSKSSGQEASQHQYGLMTSELSKHIGSDEERYKLLGILTGTEYKKGSRVSSEFAKSMIDALSGKSSSTYVEVFNEIISG